MSKYRSTHGLDLGILHLNYSSRLQEELLLKDEKKDEMDRIPNDNTRSHWRLWHLQKYK